MGIHNEVERVRLLHNQSTYAFIHACREANSWLLEEGIDSDMKIYHSLYQGFEKVFWNCPMGWLGEFDRFPW
jgi:hypothetical protein